jgi:hypothetical protein
MKPVNICTKTQWKSQQFWLKEAIIFICVNCSVEILEIFLIFGI